jgi:peptidoglycan/LPS O-acetylase OafA/YrhL
LQLRAGKYFENLDALRLISFLFIFWGHALDTESDLAKTSETYLQIKDFVYVLGKTGFSFAFILSSYINTFVILEEKERTGQFHPWKFYVRRALRIWPLYFLMIAFCFLVFPFLKNLMGETYQETTPSWPFLTFTGNFYLIYHGFPYLPALSVLWSVSVEEQFYLVWPWLLWLFDKKKGALLSGLFLVFFSFTFYAFSEINVFFHTLFMSGDIAVGAMFAFLSFKPNSPLYRKLSTFSTKQIVFIYLAFGLCLLWYHPLFENTLFPAWFNLCIERLTLGIFMGFFIFDQNFGINSPLKLGSLKVVSYLGLISYGLFCFHEVGLMAANKFLETIGWGNPLLAQLVLKPLLALLLIIPLSILSFKAFERPILALKFKFYGN